PQAAVGAAREPGRSSHRPPARRVPRRRGVAPASPAPPHKWGGPLSANKRAEALGRGHVVGVDLERALVVAARPGLAAEVELAVAQLHVKARLGLAKVGGPPELRQTALEVMGRDQAVAERPVVLGLEGVDLD